MSPLTGGRLSFVRMPLDPRTTLPACAPKWRSEKPSRNRTGATGFCIIKQH